MTNRKTNTRGGMRGSRWLLHFLMLRPVQYLILIAIVTILLFWQAETLESWINNIASNIWQLFGWGLILVAITIGTLAWLIWQRKLPYLVRYWHYWLSSITCIMASWGILALRDLGGSFGSGIIGPSVVTAVLRILGLFVLCVVLATPRGSIRFLTKSALLLNKSALFLWKLIKVIVTPKPPPKQRMPLSRVTVAPKLPEMEIESKVATPTLATTPTRQELRQVAQEVWKKYGESSKSVIIDGWQLPPIDILDKSTQVEYGEADNIQRARLIEDALASYGVDAKVVKINTGPTVTQFGVEPGWDRRIKEVKERDKDGNVNIRQEEISKTRVKVERITSLANDLALALASSSIRIEAPVPGQSVVGIEVPNVASSVVSLRGVIETSAFQRTEAKSKLTLALGEGTGGEGVAGDLGKMPHLLIAGATGSGKTVCLNSTICCLLLHNTPFDVRFIMIDPKRVELTPFNSIPHLAIPVIVNTDRALGALRWLNQEMDNRYKELAKAGARNIEIYNRNKQGKERLPYIVLVIDELADLMMAGFDEVEHILCRLAQLARATGIHLIVATQRPSVDVVTGLIKANFPTRISFAVTSQVDSRTILDGAGAEKLLGKGDMLYMPTEAAKPKRLQGCFVSDAETERLVYFWGGQKQEDLSPMEINESLEAPTTSGGRPVPKDPLMDIARQMLKEYEHVSTSFLQRKLRIGYPRAARIMEQLEEEMAQEKDGVVEEEGG